MFEDSVLMRRAYPTACCRGLRGAGGISTASSIAANSDRGFYPKNRSTAVVPSARMRKKLCIAVRHARFRGWASPCSWWLLSERTRCALPPWSWSA